MLNPPTADPGSTIAHVGVAIKRVGSNNNQRHVALVYRRGDNSLRLSHLLWHKRFADEPWDGTFHWAPAGDLDREIEEPIVAARLASIEALRPQIPYGFHRRGCRFVIAADGTLTFNADKDVGAGLTCSTYIHSCCP